MIPIKLILEGINSYRQRQEIDFSRLTVAGIFGIFGRVGSGKSTILEAITFALYDEMERISSRDQFNYNITNLRADRLLIDFECRTGREDARYRFVVEGKRNSKKFEEVKFDRKCYQWMVDTSQWMPVACKDPAESILKLNYKNFKRTVIIPQGRFQEFIELKDTDRTEMMKGLFGLSRFDLGEKTDRLSKQNDGQLSEINGQLAQVGDATPEKLDQAEVDLKNVIYLIATNEKNIGNKQAEEKVLEERWKKTQELMLAAEGFEALIKKQEFFANLQAQAQQYSACLRDFKALLDAQFNQQKLKDEAEKKQLNLRADLAKNTDVLNGIVENLKTLRPQYDARETTMKRADTLLVWAELKGVEVEIEKLNQRVEKGGQVLGAEKTKLDKLKQERQKLEADRNQLRQHQLDLGQLLAIKNWFEKRDNLLEQKQKIKENADVVVGQERGFVEKKRDLLIDYPDINQTQSILDIQEKLRQRVDRLEVECEKLSGQIEHLAVRDALHTHAQNLHQGDPCPLCGATQHPYLAVNEGAKAATDAVRLRQAELKKQIEATQNVGSKMGVVQANLTNCEERKTALRKEFDANKQQIAAHDLAFEWPQYQKDQSQALDADLKTAEKQKEAIEKLDGAITENGKETRLTEAELLRLEIPLEELRHQARQKQDQANLKRGQMIGVDLADFEHLPVESLRRESAQLKNQCELDVEKYENQEKERQKLVTLRDGLSGQLEIVAQSVTTTAEGSRKLDAELGQKIHQSGFESESQIRTILGSNFDLEGQQRAILEYNTAFLVAQKEYERLRTDVGNTTYDPHHHDKVKEELQILRAASNDHRKASGRLETEIGQLKTQLKNQSDLRGQKEKLELRRADLKRMTSLFRSVGFVNYVSEVYLHNLAQQANERFHRMTSQQLQIEVSEKNNFIVRDLLNNGKTRGLNTLSGGQRFQAALCLALALADNVHTQLQSRENFFFLDEGFGSLDKESLQTVFETLKSLRKENRIVGVISHVEDLQQEMDVYLKIENTEESGSVVQCI